MKKVAYGGKTTHDFCGSNYKANIGANTDSQLTIENSTISYGAGYGVYAKGTVNAIESLSASNTFSNNSLGNVFKITHNQAKHSRDCRVETGSPFFTA